jgi:hypothetical protein
MTFDPSTIVQTATSWLETIVKYEGQCRAEFAQTKRAIESSGTICFGSPDGGSVEIECDPETPDPSFDSPAPQSGNYRLHGGTNPCVALSVRTADGEFIANDRIIQEGTSSGPGYHRIRLRPLRGRFEVNAPQQATYWVLPLSNFILDWWPPARIYPAELANHPLRIYPTPEIPPDLSEEDQPIATAYANQRNRLVTFKIDGNLGFIEQLPSYARKIDRLRRGKTANRITAVMVGSTHLQSVDFADYDGLFPLDILSLLTLATGTPVGAPWIEFRDAHGKLVRRIHISFGRPMYEKGHAGVFDLGRNAVGHLITRAFSSPDRGKKYLRAAINHAVAASTKMNTLETRYISICRGFETLCKHHKLDTKERLSSCLNSIQNDAVKAALDQAFTQIRGLGKHETDPARKRALERIADRARSATGKENDFGLAVVDIARKFGFPDPDILQAHFNANPHPASDNWPGLLSHFRGAALHGAYFDLPGKHDHFDILTIMDHLHDLLLRIIFKTLQYDGPYQPPIPPTVSRESVDWVTNATSANILLGCF